jgi:hypothetical protein
LAQNFYLPVPVLVKKKIIFDFVKLRAIKKARKLIYFSPSSSLLLLDKGSGMEKIRIQEKHSGSATKHSLSYVNSMPKHCQKQGCGSGFNRVCGSVSGFGIQIRIQEGKNDPQK